MRITTNNQHREITGTALRLVKELTVIQVMAAVKDTGSPARYETGLAAARHYIGTERAAIRRNPRTVRTTHDGRRVTMRRTGRLA